MNRLLTLMLLMSPAAALAQPELDASGEQIERQLISLGKMTAETIRNIELIARTRPQQAELLLLIGSESPPANITAEEMYKLLAAKLAQIEKELNEARMEYTAILETQEAAPKEEISFMEAARTISAGKVQTLSAIRSDKQKDIHYVEKDDHSDSAQRALWERKQSLLLKVLAFFTSQQEYLQAVLQLVQTSQDRGIYAHITLGSHLQEVIMKRHNKYLKTLH